MDTQLQLLNHYIPNSLVVNAWSQHAAYDIKARVGDVMIRGPILPDIFGFMDGITTAKQFRADYESAREAVGADGTVTVRINSPGGATSEGSEIYNIIKSDDGRVDTVIDGMAGSMASIVALAGEHRAISEVGEVFIHNPHGVASGDAKVIRGFAKLLDKTAETMAALYDKHMDFSDTPYADAQGIMNSNGGFGAGLTPKEALSTGFVHEIIGDQPAEAEAHADIEQLATMLQDLDNRLATHVV